MKMFNALMKTSDRRTVRSSYRSILSLLTPIVLIFTVIASFPSVSQEKRTNLENSTFHPAGMAARFNPQERLSPSQDKEPYLQLGTEYELLRPKLSASNGQTQASALNNLPINNNQSTTESLIF
jgi:hypothetical protein